MSEYLFRISTKKEDVWSNEKPKPVYFVARNKEEAEAWARKNLKKGLAVSRVTRLAERVGGVVFVGI